MVVITGTALALGGATLLGLGGVGGALLGGGLGGQTKKEAASTQTTSTFAPSTTDIFAPQITRSETFAPSISKVFAPQVSTSQTVIIDSPEASSVTKKEQRSDISATSSATPTTRQSPSQSIPIVQPVSTSPSVSQPQSDTKLGSDIGTLLLFGILGVGAFLLLKE